jgi:dTDP-glucose pyrophosphorylase/CBS domain-containing protein
MTHHWERVLLRSSNTIREALLAINAEALRMALVVDECNKLLGVVTDGDIRRGLLNGLSLGDIVSDVMNSNPIVSEPNTDTAVLKSLMEAKGILSVPILEEGVVTGLFTLHETAKLKLLENPVFLMAGGFGKRLRPLTENCPKPLLNVGGRPILETILLQFAKCGFKNFYISTHYMPEMIRRYFGNGEKWNVNISYVHEESPLGTGGALGLLPDSVPDLPLIMVNGDVLTNIDFARFLDFHVRGGGAATMCVREYEYQVPYGVIEGDGVCVTAMVEKPTYRFNVNGGMYIVNPDVYRTVKRDKVIDMPTLLEQQMETGKKVVMYPIHEYWLDIGRIDDFRRAQADFPSLGVE